LKVNGLAGKHESNSEVAVKPVPSESLINNEVETNPDSEGNGFSGATSVCILPEQTALYLDSLNKP